MHQSAEKEQAAYMSVLVRTRDGQYKTLDTDQPLHAVTPFASSPQASVLTTPLHIISTSLSTYMPPPTSPSLLGIPLDCLLLISSYSSPQALTALLVLTHQHCRAVSHPAVWTAVAHAAGYTIPNSIRTRSVTSAAEYAYRQFVIRRRQCDVAMAAVWSTIRYRLPHTERILLQSGVADDVIYFLEIQLTQFSSAMSSDAQETREGAVELPELLRASMRYANGQSEAVRPGTGLLYGARLLTAKQMFHHKRVYFDSPLLVRWLPLTDWSGHICIAMDIDRRSSQYAHVFVISGVSRDAIKLADNWLICLQSLTQSLAA